MASCYSDCVSMLKMLSKRKGKNLCQPTKMPWCEYKPLVDANHESCFTYPVIIYLGAQSFLHLLTWSEGCWRFSHVSASLAQSMGPIMADEYPNCYQSKGGEWRSDNAIIACNTSAKALMWSSAWAVMSCGDTIYYQTAEVHRSSGLTTDWLTSPPWLRTIIAPSFDKGQRMKLEQMVLPAQDWGLSVQHYVD